MPAIAYGEPPYQSGTEKFVRYVRPLKKLKRVLKVDAPSALEARIASFANVPLLPSASVSVPFVAPPPLVSVALRSSSVLTFVYGASW